MKIIDVTGDGSCFFRALYVALKHKTLVTRFMRKASIRSFKCTEEEFVESIRSVLSKLITDKNDKNMVHEVYNNLRVLSKSDYKEIVHSSFPAWFTSSFSTLPKTEQEFRTKFARGVAVKSNWVSEIEVAIVAKILYELKYHLHIFNNVPSKDFAFKHNAIYLLNRGEVHYNVLIVDDNDYGSKDRDIKKQKAKEKEKICKDGTILNPETKRCVSQTSCKGYEIFYNMMMHA